jgi:quercetin dioxygenase-like cupin family protein
MRIVTLPRREITAFASSGVHMDFLPTLGAAEGTRVHVATLRAGGTIGSHPAPVRQVFAVVEGTCRVAGADGVARDVPAGHAVVWEPGEEHQTWATSDVVAVIIETPGPVLLDDHFGVVV